MLKVILTLPQGMSSKKGEYMQAKVAAHLGVQPCDVLVLPNVSVQVLEVSCCEKPQPVVHKTALTILEE